MKTKQFDINWSPLQLTLDSAVIGGVASEQVYDASVNEYTPDYEETPLNIKIAASIIDPDGVLTDGSVDENGNLVGLSINKNLENIEWKANGEVISATDSDYEIYSSGDDIGRITIKHNISPSEPLNLEFSADYLDKRTNQVIKICRTASVLCIAGSSLVRIEADAASGTLYNPLADPDNQTVNFVVYAGDKIADTSTYKLRYEVLTDDGWREISADNVADADKTINDDGSLTINRWCMGKELTIRVRVLYNRDSKFDGLSYSEASPNIVLNWKRHIPKYDYDYTGAPLDLPTNDQHISPTAKVVMTSGNVINFERVLEPIWYAAKVIHNAATLNYDEIGRGVNPTLDLSGYMGDHGASLGLELVEIEPVGVAVDSDGAVFTDSDGAVFYI